MDRRPRDSAAAQYFNPHPAGTYKDTPELRTERLARYTKKEWRSPLFTPRNLRDHPVTQRRADGAYRRIA